MVSNNLLMQFQADILDRPVVKPVIQETTALGAAFAAGKAVGFFDSLTWTADQTWSPQMDPAVRADLYAHWKKAVTRSFDWQ
jgi:glycerol kinase